MRKPWIELMVEEFVKFSEGPGPCPSDDELLRYVQARLDGRELDAAQQDIARHTMRCPVCRRANEAVIEMLSAEGRAALPRPVKPLDAAFLAQLAAPGRDAAAPLRSWASKVAEKLEALRTGWRGEAAAAGRSLRETAGRLALEVLPLAAGPTLAPAVVRGDERVNRYEIPELDATITLVPEPTEHGWAIAGELEPDSAERIGLSGVTLRLSPAAAPGELAHEPVQTDELGCFAFENLEARTYQVEILITETASIVLTGVVVG